MYSLRAFGWVTCLSLVAAGVTPMGSAIKIRNAPGASNADTNRAIGRALHNARAEMETVAFDANVTLDRSWNEAVLFAYETAANGTSNLQTEGSVEIKCTTCYIKGLAKAQLIVADGFDADTAFQQTIDNVKGQVDNITNEVQLQLEIYVSGVFTKLTDGIDPNDFAFPTFNTSFDVDVPAIPQCDLVFTFDGIEMYIALETSLSLGATTYTLNLFSSVSPAGLAVGKDLSAGLVLTVDLILMVEGAIDISNGLHIKLDDGVAFHIPLFDDKVGSLAFNGGQFEFLPVTIQSADVVLSAVLRVGAQFGLEISAPGALSQVSADIRGGIEVGVFANIAEFVTNVTVAPSDDECELRVVQSYQLAVGAEAGATVMIAESEYGPAAGTSVTIWYTELVDACAIKAKSTPTPTAAVTSRAHGMKRADLTTTTISTAVRYTGVACIESTFVNCPVSYQTTTQFTVTKTLITAVPSGQDATFPESTSTGVPSTISFGKNAQSLTATSGSPVSYVPPPRTENTHTGAGNIDKGTKGKVGGIDKKAIIGGSIGGAALLIAIVAGLLLWRSKRKTHTPEPVEGSGSEKQEAIRNISDQNIAYPGAKPRSVQVTSFH